MDEQIARKVSGLLAEIYKAGVKEGRELERQEIVRSLSKSNAKAASREARAPRQRRQRAAVPPHAVQPPVPETEVAFPTIVAEALKSLQSQHADGVFPDTLADYMKAGNGNTVSVRDVRQTLKQLVQTGQARRLPRGRYMIADIGNGPLAAE